MVEKLSIEIALEGGAELQQQFAAATSSIAKLGNTAEEAFAGATAAAQKFSASTADLQKVESIIKALAARSKDSGTSFAELAANYDRARQAAGSYAVAATKVTQATKTTGVAFSETRAAVAALAQGLNVLGAGPLGRIATSIANVGTRFGALTVAAGAVVGGSVALIKFAAAAEETYKALNQLQQASGQSFENLSALATAFVRGGTTVKQFASEFGNLSEKIAAAGQAKKIREADKETVDWANDVDLVRNKFDRLAKGVTVNFSPLTTLDTKVKALLESLSKAKTSEQQWFKLADIFQSLGSDLERMQLGKALGLSPESIASLSLGSSQLKKIAEEAAALGITLDELDKKNLAKMIQSQREAGGLFDALKSKMGALVAPAITSFWEGFTDRLKELIPVFTQIAATVGRLDFSAIGAAAADFLAILGKIAAGWLGILSGQVSLKDVLVLALQEAGQALTSLATTIGVAVGEGILSGIAQAISSGIGAIWEAIKRGLGIGGGPATAGGGGGAPAMAGGGLLGGRGTGTSDSNLAWVSRGEHIMPARAVAQPGVLAFLEALRRSGGNLANVLNGMGHFALGGMVPRAIPAFATGGLAGGNNVTIQFPGLPAISGLRASSSVVDQLHKAAALAQVRSGGRKPSRYS